jgi:hypothetical protein
MNIRDARKLASAPKASSLSNFPHCAESALAECRLKSFQTLAAAALAIARSGRRIPAMNLLFESQMYAYENTLDHARAFLAYRDRIKLAKPTRRSR